MWRYDAGRTAASPEKLAETLYPQWVRHLPPPEPAWPVNEDTGDNLQFDGSYEPVVSDKRIYIPSMVRDTLTAYNTDTGKELWRFYADGPVRFAPCVYRGKIYFVSDDGYLYCLDAKNGKLVWKFRESGPRRTVIGNHRLVSARPARGAPVLYKGTLYFASGVWPFMGIFIYAIDPATGRPVWKNSGTGSIYIDQPHSSPAFAGVSPQGYCAAAGNTLLVSGGRTVPAAYDRKTGKFLYYRIQQGFGGYNVYAHGDIFINGHTVYHIRAGIPLCGTDISVLSGRKFYGAENSMLTVYSPSATVRTYRNMDGSREVISGAVKPLRTLYLASGPETIHIKAGPRLYGTDSENRIVAVDVESGKKPSISWKVPVKGRVWNMVAGDGKLFAVTVGGSVYCFGSTIKLPAVYRYDPEILEPAPHTLPEDIIKKISVSKGYCLAAGLKNGAAIKKLLAETDYSIIGIDSDPDLILRLRKAFDAAGLYGRRVSLIQGDLGSIELPPYLACFAFSEDPAKAGILSNTKNITSLYRSLRPYGGICAVPVSGEARTSFIDAVSSCTFTNSTIENAAGFVLLRKNGPLPGSGSWTHQYADPGNTVVSQDTRVKPPFSILWFGGPTNEAILPRHGHGPSPQVAGGRLVIEGMDMLRAVDAYTGCVLWEKELPQVGAYYNRTYHHPGANKIGSNYVTLSDAVYVIYGTEMLKLDPADGAIAGTITLKGPDGDKVQWGSIRVWDRFIAATSTPIKIPFMPERGEWPGQFPMEEDGWDTGGGQYPENQEIKREKDAEPSVSRYGAEVGAPFSSASKTLAILDRNTGRLIWKRDAVYNFRHNAVAAGNRIVFTLDRMSEHKVMWLKRRGMEIKESPVLYALDITTGKVLWKKDKHIFGTWLGYSQEHDILLQAGSQSLDRARDESYRGIAAYRGKDGTVLWIDPERWHEGPLLLHNESIITNGTRGTALSLLTGDIIDRGWMWSRNYGCNTAIGSEHILTFRSAAAGYHDLTHKGGTGNLGGFKSGCTSNLIPADGILSAPDYTRTCTCAYQNQTSLAVIHDPGEEMWTFGGAQTPGHIGINLGAPGDRKAQNGTLWTDYPDVGGPSPELTVQTFPSSPGYVTRHLSEITSGPLPWVASSGAKNLSRITVSLPGYAPEKNLFTVRLVFAEFNTGRKGKRIFSVAINGRTVLENFDIIKEAGGPRISCIKEFRNIKGRSKLTVTLTPSPGSKIRSVCLSGIEVLQE